MFNLDTCHVCIWGYTERNGCYHTNGHIHHGFERAFRALGRSVAWLDSADPPQDPDYWKNCLVISNHDCVNNSYWPGSWPPIRSRLPLRDDCFYVVHGMNDNTAVREMMAPFPNRLSWNVFNDVSQSAYLPESEPLEGDPIWLADEMPFWPSARQMNFRWATDLLPIEIMNLRPGRVLGRDSNVINYVGSIWWVNSNEIADFKRACQADGIQFVQHGKQARGVCSVEDNIRLVRESYMAPAISGTHHVAEGYAPCRIFKNASYGQIPLTNSPRMNELFGGRAIFHPDCHELYQVAKERLAQATVEQVHELMNWVGERHTYLNRIAGVLQAVRLVQAL